MAAVISSSSSSSHDYSCNDCGIMKKQVSFSDVEEVRSLEQIDSSLAQELFYQREDYLRFKCDWIMEETRRVQHRLKEVTNIGGGNSNANNNINITNNNNLNNNNSNDNIRRQQQQQPQQIRCNDRWSSDTTNNRQRSNCIPIVRLASPDAINTPAMNRENATTFNFSRLKEVNNEF